VTINQASGQADSTGTSPVHFTVVFNEPVADFATGDVTLSGTAGATTAAVTGGPTEYDVAVSGMTTNGTVIASIGSGVAHDAAGNGNAASTSTDNTVSFVADGTVPDTTITDNPNNPSSSSSASFAFSGTDDQTAPGSLTFECQIDGGGFTSCTSTQTYTGLVESSHTFQVRAIDASGNIDPTPASFTWVIDTTAPTVSINQASGQADPTGTSPVHFTVVFNEPVSDFATGDVTLSGTAGATTAAVTGGPTEYDVAVSGMTTNGTVIASVGSGVAHDAAGNGNTASTSTDNTVTFNANAAPSVVVVGGRCSSSNLGSGTLNLALFDPNGDRLTFAVVSSSNSSLLPTSKVAVSGSGRTRSVTFTAASKRSGVAVVTFRLSDGKVTVPFVVTVRVGTDAKETLNGTGGTDVIFGRNGRNTINGFGGNDLLCGGNGDDWLLGGEGNDILVGQNGNDVLDGMDDDDQLDAGGGNDTMFGRAGSDSLRGGSGRDFFSGGPGFDVALDFSSRSGDVSDGTIP
jgi:Ca2+-binding RTX toxin-like protein